MERIAQPDSATTPTWVAGLLHNDPSTIRGMYHKHFPTIKQYVILNRGTGSDAEDVFQEAVTVLWLSVKEGRLVPDTDPGGFLYRVAKNKWLDIVRSAAHKYMKVVHDDRLADIQAEAIDDVEERLQRLRGIYADLDDKCRTVLDRYYFERKSLASIAAELGVEEESIRTIKYRCMMKLRAFRKDIIGEEQQQV